MTFPHSVYLAAGISACLAAAVASPLWRQWCLRTGLLDDPGHRKIHQAPVPLAGGLAVLTGIMLPLGLAVAYLLLRHTIQPGAGSSTHWTGLLSYGLNRRAVELGAILLGAVATVVLGWVDDRHELRPAYKFIGQLVIALAVTASGVRVTLFVPSLVFSYAVTILWILTVINAFNFMDNMNGLCAGLGAIAAWHFACFAARQEQYLVALIGFLMLGALLGFLPYNFPKARAFLGDAGSHLTGYLLAVLGILPHFYSKGSEARWAVLSPLLILAVPLLDLAWVVLLRWRMRKPFYLGDTNHLSHRLVRAGLSREKAVVLIWVLAAALGAVPWLLMALPAR